MDQPKIGFFVNGPFIYRGKFVPCDWPDHKAIHVTEHRTLQDLEFKPFPPCKIKRKDIFHE